MPFLQTDLDRWEHPKISDKATVKLLAEWSEYFTQHGFDQVDMTDNNVLWGYLCARPDARVIVGPGICTLAVMRLGSINPNTGQLCIDFVARRFDGTAARFHPDIKGHVPAIIGNLAEWMMFDNRVFVKGHGKGKASENHSGDEVIIDIISRADAKQFLNDAWYQREQEWEPRGPFYTSLWDGQRFKWWLYLNSTMWGRTLMPFVTDFCLCWLNTPYNRPGFHVLTKQGNQFIIDAAGPKQKPHLLIGGQKACDLVG